MVKKKAAPDVKEDVQPIIPKPEEKKTFNSGTIKFNDLQPAGTPEPVETDGGIPIKKKRGRPPKAQQDAESQEQVLKITEDIFTPVFKLLNKILSRKYTPIVTLNDDEIMSMKSYLALVANKHLPTVIQKYGAEFTLGMLTLTITADKTIKYQEWKALQMEKGKQENKKQEDLPAK